MNKKIAALCLAIIASIPFIARSQQQYTNQYPALNNLTRDQLVSVINCMGANRTLTVDTCIKNITTTVTATSTVRVIYPNDKGSIFTEESDMAIRWTASSTKTIDILLLSNKAGTVNIVSGITNSGSYTWKVKASAGYDADYQIAIRANGTTTTAYDLSDNSFKISPKPQTASLFFNLSSNPRNNNIISSAPSNSYVYGLDIMASSSIETLRSVDLAIAVVATSTGSIPGSVMNPSTLVRGITVTLDGKSIYSASTNSASYTKDANGNYYIRLTNLNSEIQPSKIYKLLVSFDTYKPSGDMQVNVSGYGTQAVRTEGAGGVNYFYNISGPSFTRMHRISVPFVNPELRMIQSASPIRSQNIALNENGGANVPVLDFGINAYVGSSKLNSINVDFEGVRPTSANLYDNAYNLISSATAVNGAITFDDIDMIIANNMTAKFIVKASYPSTYASTSPGSGTYTKATVRSIVYNNGVSEGTLAANISGNKHYVYRIAPNFTINSNPTIAKTGTGTTTILTASFGGNISVKGGTVETIKSGDIRVAFKNGSTGGVYYANPQQVSVIVDGVGNNGLPSGSATRFNVTSIMPTSLLPSGIYSAVIESIKWNTSINQGVVQNWGLEDFKTVNSMPN